MVHFLRHLGEMTVAMMIGMGLLEGAVEKALAAAFAGALPDDELYVLAMALSMSVPMAAWMRYRGHGWASTAEMSAAMIIPAVALFVVLRLGAISGDAALAVQHAIMLPSMIAAMLYRRSEYLG
jgi:flagellar biosynthetic protein FliP